MTNFLHHLPSTLPISPLLIAGAMWTFDASPAFAQAEGLRIVEQSPEAQNEEDDRISSIVKSLDENGKLVAAEILQAQILTPQARPLKLAPTSTKTLTPIEVAQRAKEATYRVGWTYLCSSCDSWHLTLAGGYAITTDGGIATCAHVLEAPTMRKGSIIAVDFEGNVFPATAVNAYDDAMDAAIITIDHTHTPLALNTDMRPGNKTFCFSDPLGQRNYFSQGMVNRFYWMKNDRNEDDMSLEALRHLRLNVSTPWAPGSSGAPVVDIFGNAIGHVSEIEPLANDTATNNYNANESAPATLADVADAATMITLHIAIPARSLIALAKSLPAPAAINAED